MVEQTSEYWLLSQSGPKNLVLCHFVMEKGFCPLPACPHAHSEQELAENEGHWRCPPPLPSLPPISAWGPFGFQKWIAIWRPLAVGRGGLMEYT